MFGQHSLKVETAPQGKNGVHERWRYKVQSTPYIIKVDKKGVIGTVGNKTTKFLVPEERYLVINPSPDGRKSRKPPQQPTTDFYKYVLPGIDETDFMVRDIR